MALMALIPFVILAVFFVLLLGASAYMGWTAYTKHKRVKLLAGTNMRTIATLKPGVAKTTGLVRAYEETVRCPMQRRDVVFYEFTVEELRQRTVTERVGNRTRTRTENYWATIVHDRDSVRFAVEDDTGEAEIDLEGAEVTMQSASRANSGTFETVPDSFERMLRKRYNTSTKGLLFNRTLRYTEIIIEEGDSLIVLGEVREKTREKRRVLAKGKETPLIISDKSDKALLKGYQNARLGYALGACFPILLMIPLGFIWYVALGATKEMTKEGQNAPSLFGQQDKRDFVQKAQDDIQSDDIGKRRSGLEHLCKEPFFDHDRDQYQKALADEGRRREVAAIVRGQLNAEPGLAVLAVQALKIWGGPDDTTAMLERLPNANDQLRVALLDALSVGNDSRLADALLPFLHHPHRESRDKARGGLQKLRVDQEKLLTRTLTDLSDKDESRCRSALGWLEKLDPNRPTRGNVAKALEPLTTDGNREIKMAAVKALCVWGGVDSLPALERLLEDPELQQAVITGLGSMRDSRAVAVLVKLLSTNQGNLAADSLKKMGKIGEKEVLALLHAPNRDVRGRAAGILNSYGTTTKEKLKQAVLDMSSETSLPETVVAALDTVKQTTPPSTDKADVSVALTLLIKHRDKNIGATACRLLATWGDKDSVPALIEALTLPDVDRGAMEALGKLKDVRAVTPLVKKLGHIFTVRDATNALEAIGPPATKDLVAALSDISAKRDVICQILGKVGTMDAVPDLQKLAAELAKSKDGNARKLAGAADKASKDIQARKK